MISNFLKKRLCKIDCLKNINKLDSSKRESYTSEKNTSRVKSSLFRVAQKVGLSFLGDVSLTNVFGSDAKTNQNTMDLWLKKYEPQTICVSKDSAKKVISECINMIYCPSGIFKVGAEYQIKQQKKKVSDFEKNNAKELAEAKRVLEKTNDIRNALYNIQEKYKEYEKEKKELNSLGKVLTLQAYDGFWVSETKINQKTWKIVMDGILDNKSEYKGDNLPITNVSWIDCLMFCNRLSEMLGLNPFYKFSDFTKVDVSGKTINGYSKTNGVPSQVKYDHKSNGFRLPTSFEWEYAAKANESYYRFSGGNKLLDLAWVDDNAKEINRPAISTTRPLKTKLPNAWGFYDFLGNGLEWCQDEVDKSGDLEKFKEDYIYRFEPSYCYRTNRDVLRNMSKGSFSIQKTLQFPSMLDQKYNKSYLLRGISISEMETIKGRCIGNLIQADESFVRSDRYSFRIARNDV